MVNNDNSDLIIKRKVGNQTGDTYYQTADGRWWKTYHGERLHTGEEVKRLRTHEGH